MKKLYLYFFLTITILLLNSCVEEFVNDNYAERLEKEIPIQQDTDIIFNGDYLQFKSLEVYDSICKVLSDMEYEEFQQWESKIGFKSARTWKEKFIDEITNTDNKEAQEAVTSEYSDKFNYDAKNQIVRYRFFANSLDRVLNIDGYVQIDNSLYKFTEDNQYISYDGNKSRIEDALLNNEMKSQEINNDHLLFVKNENSYKSSNTVALEGIKTVGERRLIYSVNEIIYSTFYAIDPYTGIAWYQWGYGVNLKMSQEKLNWLNKWKANGALYYLRNMFMYWHEVGIGGPSFDGPIPDKNYTKKYRTEVTHYFIDVGYIDTYAGSADFAYNLDVTFWSSGITESNKISISID
ncbi:DUF4848 domain-containing protein [Roseimarinus sediminis]|uniref:DUF4848 domain-containing protein n=1 Tax=Roseimarinus sediminis TaxID=1610899 RepID=UPI003D1A9BBD